VTLNFRVDFPQELPIHALGECWLSILVLIDIPGKSFALKQIDDHLNFYSSNDDFCQSNFTRNGDCLNKMIQNL